MPDPKMCDKIADPAARERCKNYEGEFAEPADYSVQQPGPKPWVPKPRPPFDPTSAGRRGGLAGGMPRRNSLGKKGGGWGSY